MAEYGGYPGGAGAAAASRQRPVSVAVPMQHPAYSQPPAFNVHTGRQNQPKMQPKRASNLIGPYLLLQTVGEGEFAKVKLGMHIESGDEAAIKLMKKENVSSAARLAKVQREIAVLRACRHPHIVRLYDVIETEKYIAIILEYASGGELFDHILAHRYLKDKDACRLFTQLISGVSYMHSKNIVHRDLKLENLLLDRNRNLIITDFGFANQFGSGDGENLMATSCGSPCYAAPELVVSDGKYIGLKVDIWSCGVILYAMLSGYLPWDDDPSNPDGDNISQLYKYIVSTSIVFPDYISPDARDLIRRMLVANPVRRCDMETIMAHRWTTPYAHMFQTTVTSEDTESDVSSAAAFPPHSTATNGNPPTQLASQNPASLGTPGASVMAQYAPNIAHLMVDVPQAGPDAARRNHTIQIEFGGGTARPKQPPPPLPRQQEVAPMQLVEAVVTEPSPYSNICLTPPPEDEDMQPPAVPAKDPKRERSNTAITVTAEPEDKHMRPPSPATEALNADADDQLAASGRAGGKAKRSDSQSGAEERPSRRQTMMSSSNSASSKVGDGASSSRISFLSNVVTLGRSGSSGSRRKAHSAIIDPNAPRNTRTSQISAEPSLPSPLDAPMVDTAALDQRLDPTSEDIIGDLPASTDSRLLAPASSNAARKVMDWFRKKSRAGKVHDDDDVVSSTEEEAAIANRKRMQSLESKIRVHTGPVDQGALTSRSPEDVMKQMRRVLLEMGCEFKTEGDFHFRCARPKKRENGGNAVVALPGVDGAVVDKNRAHANGQQASVASAGKRTSVFQSLLKRNVVPSPAMLLNPRVPRDGRSGSIGSDITSNGSLTATSSTDGEQEGKTYATIYGESMIDSGEEIRFGVELRRIANLKDLYIVDVRRLRGNIWGYKFVYHTFLEKLDLKSQGYITTTATGGITIAVQGGARHQ